MSLKNLLAELQRDYLASFPEKVKNIETLWNLRSLEELHTEYHKLKGTGRTYGLPEVTQLGEALEALCERNQAALPQAVPLSITILERIRAARTQSNALDLDQDHDFQVINAFVRSVKKAG